MAKVWIATIENGVSKMADYTRANFVEWCKANEGAQVRIEPEKHAVSQKMRGYYFSAVIPLIRSTCDEWAHLSTIEMHEVIKKMLFYFETYNPRTKRIERFGRSVMSDTDWNSTAKAMQFLDVITAYLADCGIEMPNPEEYKQWRDSMGDSGKRVEYPNEQALADKF